MRIRSFIMAFVCAFLFTAAAYSQTAPAADQPAQPQAVAKPGQLGFDVNGWKLNIYGFVKIDGVFNTANVLEESTPLYVMYGANATERERNKDGSFVLSLRTTRLGLKITAPTFLKATPTGVIEADFWGQMPISGSAVRQGGVRMRHAYVRLDWPTKTYFMAGQFWSVVMPDKVQPDMVAFIPMGASGLLFMREPQITLGQSVAAGDVFKATFEASIARPQSGDDSGNGSYTGSTNSQLEDRGAGEASGFPGSRARITFEVKPIDKMEIIFGGTGSYQQEKVQKYDFGGTNNALRMLNVKRIYSYVGLGFLKVGYHLFSVYGNVFLGNNIDGFFAGIMQGQTNHAVGLDVLGGWGELSLDFNKVQLCPIKLSAGYGAEKILNSGMANAGIYTSTKGGIPRVFNSTIFANIWYMASQFYKVGFEFGKNSTKYAGKAMLENYRYQFAFQFVF